MVSLAACMSFHHWRVQEARIAKSLTGKLSGKRGGAIGCMLCSMSLVQGELRGVRVCGGCFGGCNLDE